MSADGFVVSVGNGHFLEHVLVAHEHTGEVHHLTQPDDTFPLHSFRHLFRSDVRPGSLKPGSRGNTRRHLDPNMNRLLLRFVHHQFHTPESKYIRDLMRVDEHTRCTAHCHRAHKFGDSHHSRFDMHVTIKQTGNQITPHCVDDFCLLTNGMTCILPNICNMTILDGNIRVGNDLP